MVAAGRVGVLRLPVVQLAQFLLEVLDVEVLADIDLGGQRVHACRHVPAPALELFAHYRVQVNDIQRQGEYHHADGDRAGDDELADS